VPKPSHNPINCRATSKSLGEDRGLGAVIGDRPYGGKIALRVSPETHRRAATCAQAAGMSLNQWIAHRIETGT
jgi:hypothetical protein